MRDYPDYVDTVRRAGINAMIAIDPATGQRGPHYDERVARAIAEAAERGENPVEAAYLLARGILGEHRPSAPGRETETDPPAPAPAPSPSDRPTDRPAATSERPAPAERRPAPVSERVDNGARPRSVRDLPPAGAPQGVRLDQNFKTYLDGQWNTNPEGVEKLFKQRPDIMRWYEGE